MTSLLRYVKQLLRATPWAPIRFPAAGFEVVGDEHVLEEERFDEFKAGHYYPVNIGDVFASRYQVVGKLGFGVTSTVWLARDLTHRGYATLKVYTREGLNEDEFTIYQRLNSGKISHPGFKHVRRALDLFVIPRAGGDHKCLVQKPMWDSFKDLLLRNSTHRFTEDLLKPGLAQLFLALDYIHTECKLVHTDIKADNILIDIEDTSILESFVKNELENPSPRKVVNDATIYASRRFDRPKRFGDVVLSDFGSAVNGNEKRTNDAQPNVYRSPEVMLKTEWSYPVDIWNVGAMIWDLFEGKHLFYGNDPDGSGYKTRAHLAEVVAALGPPPLDLLSRGIRSKEFFDTEGHWIAGIPVPTDRSLETLEENLDGESKEKFLRFLSGMLQWRPEDRKTATELLKDPYLKDAL